MSNRCPIHILCIPSWFRFGDRLLSGIFFDEQADLLKNAGAQVGMLYAHRVASFKELRSWQKSRLVDVPWGSYQQSTYLPFIPNHRYSQFTLYLQHCRKAFEHYLIKIGKPDVIFAQSVYLGGVIAASISQEYDIPFVISEHSSSLIRRERQHKINQNLAQKAYSEASLVFFVSKFLASSIQSIYEIPSEKHVIIPNALAPIFLDSPITQKSTKPFNFIIIGNFVALKQQDLVITALAQLPNHCRLILVGDGATRKKCESLASQLGVDDRCQFVGNLSRAALRELFFTTNCLISASSVETFGMSIIEALACGVPVISFNSGGPAEIISPENGILLQEKSIDGLTEAMKTMLHTYERYDSANIAKDCRQKYHPDTIGELYVQHLQAIL